MVLPMPTGLLWSPVSPSSKGAGSGTYSRHRTGAPTWKLFTARGVGRIREKTSTWPWLESPPLATCSDINQQEKRGKERRGGKERWGRENRRGGGKERRGEDMTWAPGKVVMQTQKQTRTEEPREKHFNTCCVVLSSTPPLISQRVPKPDWMNKTVEYLFSQRLNVFSHYKSVHISSLLFPDW